MGTDIGNKGDIYEQLLSDIILLKYKPGEFIREADLSARFNVSRTPMREVIKKLAADGYIQVMPRHGNRVALIDTASVKQMIDMRIVLETAVQKQLVFSISDAQIQTLSEIISRQASAINYNDTDAFWELDNRFHATMFELAGKPVWWETIKKYEPHYMRFRKLEMSDNTNYDLLFIHHKNILQNIVKRRVEEVEPSIRSHVSFCIERMPVLIERYPEYFKK